MLKANNKQLGFRIPGRKALHPKGQNAFVFDSDIYKKYYSSLDLEIYFGGSPNAISDLLGIQFVVQQNTMPLFGYNSYVYDEVAVGSRIVNGSFSIHFTRPRMLLELINLPENVIDEYFYARKERDNLREESETSLPVYGQSQSPLWDKTFDIVIQYGNPVDFENRIIEPSRITLTGVQIVSSTQGHDISGEPVIDTYNFIARDIIFEDIRDPVEGRPEPTPPDQREQPREVDFEIRAYGVASHEAEAIALVVHHGHPEGTQIESIVHKNPENETIEEFEFLPERHIYRIPWYAAFPDTMDLVATYIDFENKKQEREVTVSVEDILVNYPTQAVFDNIDEVRDEEDIEEPETEEDREKEAVNDIIYKNDDMYKFEIDAYSEQDQKSVYAEKTLYVDFGPYANFIKIIEVAIVHEGKEKVLDLENASARRYVRGFKSNESMPRDSELIVRYQRSGTYFQQRISQTIERMYR